MAKSDEDLQFVLGFDADTEKAEGALDKLVGKATGMLGGILGNLTGGGGKGGGLGSSIGGIVGGAMGGPAGAAVGGMIGGKVDGLLAPIGKAFDALKDPVGTLTAGLEGLQGPLGIIGVVLPEFLTKLLGPLTQMAGLASPASLMLFNQALEDTQAVIGRTFVPVLDSMRDAVRLFGDVLASILPDTNEVNDVLSEAKAAFNEFRGSVRDAMGEFGPVIKTGLLVVIKALGDAAAWTMRQLQPLVRWIGDFFRPIREALGLTAQARSSVGAAARGANFSGFDEYSRKMQLAAFAGPSGAAPEVRATNEVRDAIDRIHAWLDRNIGQQIDNAVDENVSVARAVWAGMTGDAEGFEAGLRARPRPSARGDVGGGTW